jgi:hypothetical protein
MLSGFYFQQFCKWNLDDRYPIRKWKSRIDLRLGDSIFLKVRDIPYFMSLNIHTKVVLVVHNSDESFTDYMYSVVEPYIIKVRAVNCVTSRAEQIPLGIRDDQYISHRYIIDSINHPPVKRDILCLVNFISHTNPERKNVYDLFKGNPHCKVDHEYMYYNKSHEFTNEETVRRQKQYYETLKRSIYSICPQGTGIDTHRIYECIYLGVIPIVLSSPLDPMYSTMPIKIVKDWDSVASFLEDEYYKHTLRE